MRLGAASMSSGLITRLTSELTVAEHCLTWGVCLSGKPQVTLSVSRFNLKDECQELGRASRRSSNASRKKVVAMTAAAATRLPDAFDTPPTRRREVDRNFERAQPCGDGAHLHVKIRTHSRLANAKASEIISHDCAMGRHVGEADAVYGAHHEPRDASHGDLLPREGALLSPSAHPRSHEEIRMRPRDRSDDRGQQLGRV